MKLTVQNVDIREFKEYLGVLDQLSTDTKQDGLNAFLFYSTGQNRLNLILKDSFTFASVDIPCQIINDKDEMGFDWGLGINSNTLSYILSSYQEEQLASMNWELGEAADGKSFFRIVTTYDNLSLPHLTMTPDQISELRELLSTPLPEVKFSLSDFKDQRNDFLAGMADCMGFVSDDDRKNNAVALYTNRMMVNDQRHIFIYDYNLPALFLEENTPVVLHKKIVRTLLAFWSKKAITSFDAAVAEDQKKVFITAPHFVAILNNALANIIPPQKADLVNLTPLERTCTPLVKDLLDTATFFSGFYKGGMEFKPIMVETLENEGIKFTLRDSGVAGFNSSNIERMLPVDVSGATPGCSSTLLNDSLIKFLKTLPATKEDTISMFMDSDHPAVYLSGAKKKIYLARLR